MRRHYIMPLAAALLTGCLPAAAQELDRCGQNDVNGAWAIFLHRGDEAYHCTIDLQSGGSVMAAKCQDFRQRDGAGVDTTVEAFMTSRRPGARVLEVNSSCVLKGGVVLELNNGAEQYPIDLRGVMDPGKNAWTATGFVNRRNSFYFLVTGTRTHWRQPG
jgi:hypothetical protein